MTWESLREQGMAVAGLRAAREGLVGRKGRTLCLSANAGGTPRWEMCWQSCSLGKGYGPVIQKPAGLLSVFLIVRN